MPGHAALRRDRRQHPPLDQVEAVRAAHPDVPLFIYPDAGHGFNCDVRVSYNVEAAAEARARTMAFLAQHLG